MRTPQTPCFSLPSLTTTRSLFDYGGHVRSSSLVSLIPPAFADVREQGADNGPGTGIQTVDLILTSSTPEQTYNQTVFTTQGKCRVSATDGGSLPGSLGKERKHSSWVVVLAVGLVAVTILGATAGLLGQIGNINEPPASLTQARTSATVAYTTHGPISINGNGDFIYFNGVRGGSGTASDPYIISDWDITVPANSYGIQIADTDVHFIVRNCYVHGLSSYVGIDLYDCSNGTLEDNNCSSHVIAGISLYSSQNNTLVNNNCSSNVFYGIFLGASNNNTLVNNNCSSSDLWGIYLTFSSNCNNISWNLICNNAEYGVYVLTGSSNRICNNTFIGNNGATGTYDGSHAQARDNGTNNWWNSTDGYGNYWSDWTTPDSNHDGIVDVPYSIAGSAGAKDYYPLTTVHTQIPEFDMMPLVAIALMAVIVLAGETMRNKKSRS